MVSTTNYTREVVSSKRCMSILAHSNRFLQCRDEITVQPSYSEAPSYPEEAEASYTGATTEAPNQGNDQGRYNQQGYDQGRYNQQ
jgi:hypothetical protein